MYNTNTSGYDVFAYHPVKNLYRHHMTKQPAYYHSRGLEQAQLYRPSTVNMYRLPGIEK